jgi:nucleoside 2-deoxyribosyltransferase
MTVKEATYLAGAMEGVSEEDMKAWRKQATDYLDLRGIITLDPTRRMGFHTTEMDVNNANRILKMDLQDIAHSRVVLADLRNSVPGKKWGTVMEIAFAQTKHKIIVVVMDKDQFEHPFIRAYATEIHHTLEDALEAVSQYYL